MFSIDLSARAPIYEQLYNNVVRMISLGVMKPGDKLPPVRTLATDLSVNPNTVAKAYKLLEADGYICSAVGKGSFVSEDISVKNAEKQEALSRLSDELKKAASLGVTREDVARLLDEIF